MQLVGLMPRVSQQPGSKVNHASDGAAEITTTQSKQNGCLAAARKKTPDLTSTNSTGSDPYAFADVECTTTLPRVTASAPSLRGIGPSVSLSSSSAKSNSNPLRAGVRDSLNYIVSFWLFSRRSLYIVSFQYLLLGKVNEPTTDMAALLLICSV